MASRAAEAEGRRGLADAFSLVFKWFRANLTENNGFQKVIFWKSIKLFLHVFLNGFKRRSELIGHWRLQAGTRQQFFFFEFMQKMTFERITFKNASPDLDREV